MKCPKCGEKLKKDFLYCEKCGEEIQIVPDFEPEIENSIIETLSAVADQMSPTVEMESGDELEEGFTAETETKVKRNVMISVLVLCLLIFAGSAFVLFRGIYLNNYYESQLNSAQQAYNRKDYVQAASFYEKALKLEENNSLLISYADCLYEVGELDRALSNYYAVIENEPENEMAYARIIAIYEKEEAYDEINRLLTGASQKIQNEFRDYMVFDPKFNFEGGEYGQVIPLRIETPTTGKVYYSMDGSDPKYGGIEYTAPIFLRYGQYTIKAVFINDYGLSSEVVEAEYLIEGTQPDVPAVFPESGQFNLPQMISIEVPKGCTVYYTVDGSVPDDKSFIYGEPIPMKEGVTNYRFVTVNEDGVYSEVVARSYQLVVETSYTAVDSVYRLKHRLLEKERILDLDGNLANAPGKNIYVYNSIQIVQDKIFHIIYEYYQEGNSSRNMTGNIYGIDVSNGYVYKIVKDENGEEILDPI